MPWSFSSLFPPREVLAMNSGQAWLINRFWGEGPGKAWGRGQMPACPRPGSWGALYRREDAQEGTLSSGGSLEPHCLQKVFTCVRHAGARSTELPGGSPGGVGLPALRQHRQGLVSASLQICTVVSFYLQAGGLGKQARGGGCQRQRRACSPCPGLLGQVTCQPQGVPA